MIAKPGLDGHDRGAKIIARALRDAGMEVIYTGLHQTPEQIVETAIQEDADAVGISILSGAHMTLVPRILDLLRENGAEDVIVVLGGTIPNEDADELPARGCRRGLHSWSTDLSEIIEFLRSKARHKRSRQRGATTASPSSPSTGPTRSTRWNGETLTELRDRLRELALDTDAHAVVLTGAGEKAFAAGADIMEMTGDERARGPRRKCSATSAGASWSRCRSRRSRRSTGSRSAVAASSRSPATSATPPRTRSSASPRSTLG